MWLDVICSPHEIPVALAELPPAATCAVIDVVRATTSLVGMGDGGARQVVIAGSVDAARELEATYPAALLAGESGGIAPTGFDFGNSPAELALADLRDRTVIFATTNGTRAILACQTHGAGTILAAALRNAAAIASAALALDSHAGFALVCAGRAQRVALDDLFTAGVIATLIQQRAQAANLPLMLTEGAHLACAVAASAGAPLAVLERSDAGQAVSALGLADDLPLCASLADTDVVPRVTGRGPHGEVLVAFH